LVLPGEKGEEVRAVAAPGYTFTGWSNLTWKETTIDDPNHEWGIFGSRHLEIIAYFEPIKKTFTYDYCYEIGAPYKTTQITIDRNAIDETEFITPQREGYTFCGWYADKDYTTRITTANGRYMYGYAAFTLETDTLYARWEKEGEKTDNHKILMVFVDEIKTTLYSSVVDKDIEVESKMVALEYELAKWTVSTMYSLLNEWFDGKIKFEVDSYYTTQMVTEGFDCGLYNGDFYEYSLFANDIAEIGELNYAYNNTITTIGCHDYDNKLFQVSGVAGIKNAFVTRDTTWYHCKINNILPQNHLKKIIEGKIDLNETIVETCLHELIHTAEMYFPREDHLDLHDAIGYAIVHYGGISNISNTLKPCLLGEFEMEGEMFCVPLVYWLHKIEISIKYAPMPIEERMAGRIIVAGENTNFINPFDKNILSRLFHMVPILQ